MTLDTQLDLTLSPLASVTDQIHTAHLARPTDRLTDPLCEPEPEEPVAPSAATNTFEGFGSFSG